MSLFHLSWSSSPVGTGQPGRLGENQRRHQRDVDPVMLAVGEGEDHPRAGLTAPRDGIGMLDLDFPPVSHPDPEGLKWAMVLGPLQFVDLHKELRGASGVEYKTPHASRFVSAYASMRLRFNRFHKATAKLPHRSCVKAMLAPRVGRTVRR